jgi:hypothetical protein
MKSQKVTRKTVELSYVEPAHRDTDIVEDKARQSHKHGIKQDHPVTHAQNLSLSRSWANVTLVHVVSPEEPRQDSPMNLS